MNYLYIFCIRKNFLFSMLFRKIISVQCINCLVNHADYFIHFDYNIIFKRKKL